MIFFLGKNILTKYSSVSSLNHTVLETDYIDYIFAQLPELQIYCSVAFFTSKIKCRSTIYDLIKVLTMNIFKALSDGVVLSFNNSPQVINR